ncbi:hypothetical protein GCM10027262_35930 [Nocardia tengchongensis]
MIRRPRHLGGWVGDGAAVVLPVAEETEFPAAQVGAEGVGVADNGVLVGNRDRVDRGVGGGGLMRDEDRDGPGSDGQSGQSDTEVAAARGDFAHFAYSCAATRGGGAGRTVSEQQCEILSFQKITGK